MSQKKIVICFVSLLIFGLLFSVSLVGSSIERNSNPEKSVPPPEVGHKLLPENEMPPAFITWGKLPKFENKEMEREWLEKLTKLGERLDGADVPFWYPDGPVVAHGTGADGYYHVGIREDLVGNVDNIMITKIVTTINDVARKEVGFEREVPIKFEPWGESVDDMARDDEWRPVIGGIQVQHEDQGWVYQSTLGWAAEVDSTNGFVVSGHLGHERATPVGMMIYQPTYNPPKPTGNVSSVGGTYADVAWVPFSNVSPKVYAWDYIHYIRFRRNPAVDLNVYMSGITSGTTSGTVKYINADVQSPTFGTLYDQALANYSRASGDSGAPVFTPQPYKQGQIYGIVGIHSGANRISGIWYARFSPTSGVETDVDAVPLFIPPPP